jgi:rhamnose transport system permease protein
MLAPIPTGLEPHRATGRALRLFQPQQLVLLALLGLEIAVFSVIGVNFDTWHSFFEIIRLTVELGLLALAMTPVIVTGGIDLSVGSVLGLSAVVMGMLWRDAGWPLGLAIGAAIVLSILAGGLNALLITRLRIPALIVTLGSMWLFRGMAEGLTNGEGNYTDFPHWFEFLGQGFIGKMPVQAPVLLVAVIGFWVLLHRSTIGRALSAIGFSPEGARHAGIPVERRVGLTYVLAGLSAGIAGVVFAAHWGQVKANAGTGYELKAITAVVLGGTSIFGGKGSIAGTFMGLLIIEILENGLLLTRLPPEFVDGVSYLIHHLPHWLGGFLLADGASIGSGLPSELAEILTGVLLLIAIGVDFKPGFLQKQARAIGNEEFEMKNSQVAVLSVVILLAAAIIAGGNFLLVHSIQQDSQERTTGSATGTTGGAGGGSMPAGATTQGSGGEPAPAAILPRSPKRYTIGMMPKTKGNAYFIACRKGANEAAEQLGVDLLWDGPTDPDPAKQNEVVEAWITRGVDAIAVACENGDGIASVLRKARAKGIKVLTWDADTQEDARDFFVNQATPEGVGDTLMDNAARIMGNKGEFAIITASLTASNMIAWQKAIEKRRAEKYPDMKLVTIEPCDDKQQVAFDKANTIMGAYPNVKLLMAICSPAAPGAAEAVKQSGRKDVKVIGVSLPNDNKPYVHAGITEDIVLWDTANLGYLTVLAACDDLSGKLKPGDKSMDGGRIGKVTIEGSSIILGKPFIFNKDNIDKFDF